MQFFYRSVGAAAQVPWKVPAWIWCSLPSFACCTAAPILSSRVTGASSDLQSIHLSIYGRQIYATCKIMIQIGKYKYTAHFNALYSDYLIYMCVCVFVCVCGEKTLLQQIVVTGSQQWRNKWDDIHLPQKKLEQKQQEYGSYGQKNQHQYKALAFGHLHCGMNPWPCKHCK